MSSSVVSMDTTESVVTATSAGEATAENDTASEGGKRSVTSQSSASMLRELVSAIKQGNNNNSPEKNKDSSNRIEATLEDELSRLDQMSDEINLIFEDTDNDESQSRTSALSGNSSIPSGDDVKKPATSALTQWIEKTYNTRIIQRKHYAKFNNNNHKSRSVSSSTTPSSNHTTTSSSSSKTKFDAVIYNRKTQQYDPELAVVKESPSIENADDRSGSIGTGSSSNNTATNSLGNNSTSRRDSLERRGSLGVNDLESMKMNAERTFRLEQKIQAIHEEELQTSSSSVRFELEKSSFDDTELKVADVLRVIMASSSDEEDFDDDEGSSSSSSQEEEHDQEPLHHDDEENKSVGGEESTGEIAIGTVSLASIDNNSTGSSYGPTVVVDKLPAKGRGANKSEPKKRPLPSQGFRHPQPQSQPQHPKHLYPLHKIPEDDPNFTDPGQIEPPEESEEMIPSAHSKEEGGSSSHSKQSGSMHSKSTVSSDLAAQSKSGSSSAQTVVSSSSAKEMDEMMAWWKEKEEMPDKTVPHWPMSETPTTSGSSILIPGSRSSSSSYSIIPGSRGNSNTSSSSYSVIPGSRGNSNSTTGSMPIVIPGSRGNSSSTTGSIPIIIPGSRGNSNTSSSSASSTSVPSPRVIGLPVLPVEIEGRPPKSPPSSDHSKTTTSRAKAKTKAKKAAPKSSPPPGEATKDAPERKSQHRASSSSRSSRKSKTSSSSRRSGSSSRRNSASQDTSSKQHEKPTSSRSSSPSPDSVGWEELGLSEREREALHRYEQEKQRQHPAAAVSDSSAPPTALGSTELELLHLAQQQSRDMNDSQVSEHSSDQGSVDWAEVGLSKEEREQMRKLEEEILRHQAVGPAVVSKAPFSSSAAALDATELELYELERETRDVTPTTQRSSRGSVSHVSTVPQTPEPVAREAMQSDDEQSSSSEESDSSGSEWETASSDEDSKSSDSSNSSSSGSSTYEAEPPYEDPLMVSLRAPSSEELLKEKKSSLGTPWDSDLRNVPGAYHSSNDPSLSDSKYPSSKGGMKSSKKLKAGKATYNKNKDGDASEKVLVSTGAHAIASTSPLFPKEKGQLEAAENAECYVDLLHEESFSDEPSSVGWGPRRTQKEARERRRLLWCGATGWVVALVAVAFMLGVIISTTSSDSSDSGDGSGDQEPLRELLSRVALEGGAEFDIEGSYQSQALSWLADNINLSSYTDEQKIQRWVLACVFYGTTDADNSETWISSDKWLSDTEECTWKGVVCDGIGRSVVALELPNNRLRGVFPAEISLLSSTLVTLDLHNNFLTNEGDEGHDFFQKLTKLRRLTIGSNDMVYSGIPPQFGQLTDLLVLDISDMKYSGELQGDVFTKLQVLKDLRMGRNEFNSSIPMEIGNILTLEYLHIEEAGIIGDLSFTEPMNRIFELWLDRNPGLGGTIPTTLGDTPTLASFAVSECGLRGKIPTELGWLSNLESLWLADNHLTGKVPSELGSIKQLRRLELTGNSLTGTMPTAVCTLTQPPGLLALLEADCIDELLCDCCSRCY